MILVERSEKERLMSAGMTESELNAYSEYLRLSDISNAELMEDLHLEQLEQM